MVRTEWTPDGEQVVGDLGYEDATELFVDDEHVGRRLADLDEKTREGVGLTLRLDHAHRKARYTLGPETGAEGARGSWEETDYAGVLEWAWERGLLLGPRDAAEYERLDPRMQAFICNSTVYGVSDDGFVVDTELRRGVTEAELRVEMALTGGGQLCGPGCQGE